jgi:hypothetical protein
MMRVETTLNPNEGLKPANQTGNGWQNAVETTINPNEGLKLADFHPVGAVEQRRNDDQPKRGIIESPSYGVEQLHPSSPRREQRPGARAEQSATGEGSPGLLFCHETNGLS